MNDKIQKALVAIISDKETFAGGIPQAEKMLNDLGLTQIQSGKVISRLQTIIRDIRRQSDAAGGKSRRAMEDYYV